MEMIHTYKTLNEFISECSVISKAWKERIVNNSNGCWMWVGGKNVNGYASGQLNNRTVRVHKAIYELLVKKVGRGLELDHLCKNRNCVNPRHLEEVTHLENMRRGVLANKTHCVRGHKLDGENLLPSTPKRRSCRLCGRIRVREWRKKYGKGRHG